MKKQNFVFFLSVFFVLTFVESSSVYRFDYTYNEEAGGWFKFHQVPDTFKGAFLRCHAEGAILASPLNDKFRQVMETLHRSNDVPCGIFTGIHAMFSKADYGSVEGIPLSKIPVRWAPNEPDNYKNSEDCTVMLENGTLADVQCNDSFPYICFRKKTDEVPAPSVVNCGTNDNAYKLDTRTGNCYKFHHVGVTWSQAYMTCVAEGGYLAIINSEAESRVIRDLFAENPSDTIVSSYSNDAYIGYVDIGNRNWFTIHGQSLEEAGFAKWGEGQPNNLKSYDNGSSCGGVNRDGLLNDLWCESVLFAFICEKERRSLFPDQNEL